MGYSRASKSSIVEWLIGNYVIDETSARALVEKHSDIVEKAIGLGSMAYYPCGKIAEAENLEHHGRMEEAIEAAATADNEDDEL